MADASALATVGETLAETLFTALRDEVTPRLEPTSVVLASPGTLTEDDAARLSLFLYRVSENGYVKNAPRQPVGVDPETGRDEFAPPPLALDLYYLLTAYPVDTPGGLTADTSAQHELLGLAMQELYDNPVLEATGDGAAAERFADERVTISMVANAHQEVMDVWSTFSETPYQPSIPYVVTPVRIQSRRTDAVQRVVERDVRESVPASRTVESEEDQ